MKSEAASPVAMNEKVGNYIPEGVLTEILKRLPAKSVLRLRCVQKSWDNLIQSRMFIATHLKYQKSLEKHLLFWTVYNGVLSLRYDAIQCEEDYRLEYLPGMLHNPFWYSISNGLICATNMFTQPKVCNPSSKIYLWNPAIAKFKTLPHYPCCIPGLVHRFLVWEALAFGYSSKANDYLVVKVVKYMHNKHPGIMIVVYSVKANSWKQISTENLVIPGFASGFQHLFIDGVAFWRGEAHDRGDIVLCFDTESNAMREIRLPEVPHVGPLQTYNDQSLAFIVKNSATYGFNIWVLEGDTIHDLSWKKISVTLPPTYDWRVLGFRNNGEAILAKSSEYGLASYNFQTNEIKDFVDSWNLWSLIREYEEDEEDFYDMRPFLIYPFVESLEALKFLDEDCQR